LAALHQHFATQLLPEIGPRRTAASDLLTVKEAAAILRVCTATVYVMIERGELPHVRVSNSIRIVIT
jgi:excisionase family DNA binding protein